MKGTRQGSKKFSEEKPVSGPPLRVVFTISCRKYSKQGECPEERYYNCVYCPHNAVKRGKKK